MARTGLSQDPFSSQLHCCCLYWCGFVVGPSLEVPMPLTPITLDPMHQLCFKPHFPFSPTPTSIPTLQNRLHKQRELDTHLIRQLSSLPPVATVTFVMLWPQNRNLKFRSMVWKETKMVRKQILQKKSISQKLIQKHRTYQVANEHCYERIHLEYFSLPRDNNGDLGRQKHNACTVELVFQWCLKCI